MLQVFCPENEFASLRIEGPLDEVHGRGAEEARYKLVRRTTIDLEGPSQLLDVSVAHDHDALSHGHGLGLIVGDVYEGGFELLVEVLELGTHIHA